MDSRFSLRRKCIVINEDVCRRRNHERLQLLFARTTPGLSEAPQGVTAGKERCTCGGYFSALASYVSVLALMTRWLSLFWFELSDLNKYYYYHYNNGYYFLLMLVYRLL